MTHACPMYCWQQGILKRSSDDESGSSLQIWHLSLLVCNSCKKDRVMRLGDGMLAWKACTEGNIGGCL